jgi:hypothetical protein
MGHNGHLSMFNMIDNGMFGCVILQITLRLFLPYVVRKEVHSLLHCR